MLRYVGEDCATVWVETGAPCEVTVVAGDVTSTTRTFTVGSHHYALVIVDGLPRGSVVPYEVLLDGERRWPLPGSAMPPSAIRTLGHDRPVRLAFGSCRAAAPHEPPWSLPPDVHGVARGYDALRAFGERAIAAGEDALADVLPDLLVFVGDQVYADDSSPGTQRRIQHRRARRTEGDAEPPEGVVADFEEYTWLYRETWTPDVERWLLSTVPSAMIFDDHDVIDDWNISAAWVGHIRDQRWWSEHIVGALVSYWIYQHLGNLKPERIREEGMLEQAIAAGDATELLREWALESETFTPLPGGYRFSYERHLHDVHLVVADARNGRVLEPGWRRMVDEGEWAWLVERADEPARHLVLVSSLPVFVPGGLHGIQQWNEAVCDGAWGRPMAWLGERLRQALDIEDWPAFDRSFRDLEALLLARSDPRRGDPPSSIDVLSGDIHFSYVSTVTLPDRCDTTLRQIVCSPLRNSLERHHRAVMRFGASRPGRMIGGRLQRMVGRSASALSWDLDHEPVFANSIATLTYDGECASLVVESVECADGVHARLRTSIVDPPPGRLG